MVLAFLRLQDPQSLQCGLLAFNLEQECFPRNRLGLYLDHGLFCRTRLIGLGWQSEAAAAATDTDATTATDTHGRTVVSRSRPPGPLELRWAALVRCKGVSRRPNGGVAVQEGVTDRAVRAPDAHATS
jgi:hypothetical protein